MPTVCLSRRVAELLFFLALLGAALAGCATRPAQMARVISTTTTTAAATLTEVPPTPTGFPAGWTYYLDPFFGFSLSAPSLWSGGSSGDSFGYSYYDQGTAPNGDPARLDVGVFIPVPAGTQERHFCSSPKTTTVAGFPAVVADYDPTPGSASNGAHLVRLLVANGLFYDIELSSPQLLSTLRPRLGPLFAQLLATFKPGGGQHGTLVCTS